MKKSISLIYSFIIFCAVIWLLFSIILVTGLHPALPDSHIYQSIMALLSFLSAAFLILLFFLLKAGKKYAYFLTIAFLIFIMLLTVMDDLGLIDFIVLLITVTPVVLMIKERNWFLRKNK